MHASVVIPTHNREQILRKTLGYYACQATGTNDFELVIVDDGSEDGTDRLFSGLGEMELQGSVAEKYGESIVMAREGWYRPESDGNVFISRNDVYVRYIKMRKSGRSRARNVGISCSAFPLIIFADDDIFVEPEFVKKHVEAHDPDDLRVVMGRVIHTGDLENPFSARWKLKDMNTAFLATGNASVLKKHLLEAGLFDEWYTVYGWEDFDLGIHLAENGLTSEKVKVYGYHYDPSHGNREKRGGFDRQSVYEKERERGMSAVYFYRNHPLPWVRRFTLVQNRLLQAVVNLFGRNNWFLSMRRKPLLPGLFKLIVRYKGYFDGIRQVMENPGGAAI